MFNLRNPDFRQNPYGYFRKLRASSPICRVEPHGFWAVWRHGDVCHVLKNPQLFSSSGIGDEVQKTGAELLVSTRGLLAKDPPEHTRLRKRLGRAFTSEIIQSLSPYIERSVQILIDYMIKEPLFDFVKDFSAQLPIMVICQLLGFDPIRKTDIKRWSDTLLTWRALPLSDEKEQDVRAQMYDFYDFIIAAIGRKVQQPSNDIISSLLNAQNKDDELSLEEIIGFVRMLVVAGTDTTTHLLGNTSLAFINYPEIYASIRANPDLIPQLVEESLRFDSPVQCVMRRACADTAIADVVIRKDELVLAFIASANHDETIYDQPHNFIIERMPQHHLTFGTGIHFCMGSQIARLQARIAFQHISQRFSTWRRNNGELEYFNSIFFRGLTSLIIMQN